MFRAALIVPNSPTNQLIKRHKITAKLKATTVSVRTQWQQKTYVQDLTVAIEETRVPDGSNDQKRDQRIPNSSSNTKKYRLATATQHAGSSRDTKTREYQTAA